MIRKLVALTLALSAVLCFFVVRAIADICVPTGETLGTLGVGHETTGCTGSAWKVYGIAVDAGFSCTAGPQANTCCRSFGMVISKWNGSAYDIVHSCAAGDIQGTCGSFNFFCNTYGGQNGCNPPHRWYVCVSPCSFAANDSYKVGFILSKCDPQGLEDVIPYEELTGTIPGGA